MFVRSWGEAGRPLVVLLHAQGCHSGWWEWAGPLLASTYRVLAPDFRGHGASGPADSYGWDNYAGDIESLVKEAPAYALVGHSMGGYVGLHLAARAAQRPAALVVADMKTGATEQELADLRAASELPGRTFAALEEAAGRYRLAPPEHCVPPGRLASVAQESFRHEPDGSWGARFDRRALAIEPLEPLSLAREVACPTLFLRGEHSVIMPQEPAAQLAGAARARLVTLPGLYHHLPLEAPEIFAAEVSAFLTSAGFGAC